MTNGGWRRLKTSTPCPRRKKFGSSHPDLGRGAAAKLDIALRAAPLFALQDDQTRAIIEQLSASIRDWQNIARQLGMSAANIAVYATAITG